MRRGLVIALGATLVIAAWNVMATVPSRAQTPNERSLTERRIEAMTVLVERLDRRQRRQDQIIIFGLGAIAVLILGLGMMIARRSAAAGSSETERRPTAPRVAAEQPIDRPGEPTSKAVGRFFSCMNKGAIAWFERLKQLRLNVHQAGLVRRQKRIRRLLTEVEGHVASGVETNQRFREALENLVQESARVDADIRAASDQKA